MDINSEEGNLEALCDKHQDSFLRIHVKYEARPKPRMNEKIKRFLFTRGIFPVMYFQIYLIPYCFENS